MHPVSRFIVDVKNPSILNSVPRIKLIAYKTGAQRFLEIGVNKGATFLNVDLPYKAGVDPAFQFDWQSANTGPSALFQTGSDEFFADLKSGGPQARALKTAWPQGELTFDIIFIDGLHTFAQSWRDFENSLAYAHEGTVWILDDTVPSNPYSAWPDYAFSLEVRKEARFPLTDWCGDVYKTLFAIHDRHPEFSYCTLMGFNPQTVIWRAPQQRKPAFSSLEEIDRLSYFDIFKHAELFVPVPDEEFPLLLGKAPRPEDYRSADLWRRLVYLDLDRFAPKETP